MVQVLVRERIRRILDPGSELWELSPTAGLGLEYGDVSLSEPYSYQGDMIRIVNRFNRGCGTGQCFKWIRIQLKGKLKTRSGST